MEEKKEENKSGVRISQESEEELIKEENDQHKSVLLKTFFEAAQPQQGERWVDGTLGRGGHTEALLEQGVHVAAMDRDPTARETALYLEKKWPHTFCWKQANFALIRAFVEECGWSEVDGVLLDLGVSSPQLDQAERGFSFQRQGPLDMRFDPHEDSITAEHIINEWEEEALVKIFKEEGEERYSRRIARAIVRRRQRCAFKETTDLAEVVAKAVGPSRSYRLHPATKVFQALRLVVNQEKESLSKVLREGTSLIKEGGRFAVISFHSGEDRMVKRYFRSHAMAYLDTPEFPQSFLNPEHYFEKSRRYQPTQEEIDANPRSRSARLRVAVRNEKAFVNEENPNKKKR